MVVVALMVAALAWVGQAPAAAPPWAGRYTVRAGDSLTAIAQHYGVSLQALASANGLDWREPLLIGVVLRVPSTGSATAGRRAIYVVRPGDTLSGIALRYHVSLAQLASANRIDPAGVLLIGARLRITPARGRRRPTWPTSSRATRTGTAQSATTSATRTAPSTSGWHAFAVIGLNCGAPVHGKPVLCERVGRGAAAAQRLHQHRLQQGSIPLHHAGLQCRREEPAARPAAQRAYAVGCSEAAATLQLLAATSPLAIWLDVEPGNTWSSRRKPQRRNDQGHPRPPAHASRRTP